MNRSTTSADSPRNQTHRPTSPNLLRLVGLFAAAFAAAIAIEPAGFCTYYASRKTLTSRTHHPVPKLWWCYPLLEFHYPGIRSSTTDVVGAAVEAAAAVVVVRDIPLFWAKIG